MPVISSTTKIPQVEMHHLNLLTKTYKSALIGAGIILFLIGSSAFAEWEEAVSLPFGLDDKEWELGWSNESPTGLMTEFVPKGQNVENWKELVTLQTFTNLKANSASQFLNDFLSGLKEKEPSVKINLIAVSPDEAMVEWNILNSKQNPDQYELDRVIKGKQGLHMIHYAVKGSKLSNSQRDKWLNFLRSAKLKPLQ